MTIFKKAENTQAYLKAGFMGFAGSGKTFTATQTAIGLVQYLKDKKLPEGDRPVYFLDTETGSSYVKQWFDKAGIELLTAKTRAFSDLIPAVLEAEKNGSVLIIDSLTHFWREFTETYARKLKRTKLQFQDWNYLKTEWGKFTDAYINSNLHFILCGRAGYEYDYFTDEDGKKELEKTGIKMKAETETGYEPSLLVLMEREMNVNDNSVQRTAYILKERFDIIDGKSFKNPNFTTFLPHIELLNLGGQQIGVETSRTSAEMIPENGRNEFRYKEEQKEIILEKLQALFTKAGFSGQSKEGKLQVITMLEHHFGTPSWKELEVSFSVEALRKGYLTIEHEFAEQNQKFIDELDETRKIPTKTTEGLKRAA